MNDKTTEASAENIKNLDELAIFLKKIRVTAGFTPAELAHKTKIPIEIISTLEGQSSNTKIPEKVFLRGFIQNYCKACGIEPSSILSSIKDIQTNDNAIDEQALQKIKGKQNIAKRKTISAQAFWNFQPFKRKKLIFTILLGLSMGSWLYTIITANNPPPISSKTTEEPLAIAASVNTPEPNSEGKIDIATKSPPRKEAKENLPNPNKIPTTLRLVLNISKKISLKYQVDGDKMVATEYLPGKYNFFFSKRIEIRLQDISAVNLEFNGKDLGLLGNNAEARTYIFTNSEKIDLSS